MVIETILYDLDDTLIAETQWVRTGWRVVAEFLAKRTRADPAELEAMMAEAFERDPRHVFDHVAASAGLDSESVQRCIRLYRTADRSLTVLPDAEMALRFGSAFRTGIVTDGPYCMQSTKIRGAGLASRVEVIVYTDTLGPDAGKPSPAGFIEALARLRAPAHTAVYVADNPTKDFLGPKQLGMRTVQVRRPGGLYFDVNAATGGEPDAVISSLTEFPLVLEAWEAERRPPAGE